MDAAEVAEAVEVGSRCRVLIRYGARAWLIMQYRVAPLMSALQHYIACL